MTQALVKALGSVVARLPGGGEVRPGQGAMAEAVEASIERRRHLVVQAGTGTGKTLAYLVPALASGCRVVVATATIALQDQLAHKDLPLLDCEWSILKGRANYLCRQKAAEIGGGAVPPELDLGTAGRADGQIRRLLAWAGVSQTGDRSELDFEPSGSAWASVSTGARDCPGAAQCPAGGACFAEDARRQAAEADVIVVNMHLYAAHLASGGGVLPDHDVVVFDEAHELEDIATIAFGGEVSPGRLRSLARVAGARSGAAGRAAADELSAAADSLEVVLRARAGRRVATGLDAELGSAVGVSAQRVARVSSLLRDSSGGGDSGAAALRALQGASRLANDLHRVAELDDDSVAWVEAPGAAQPSLRIAPIEVGPRLSSTLWGNVTAILTSATIPPGLGSRLGLPTGDYDELDVGSPFPYETNAMLYCALHLPDPRAPGADDAIAEELCHLIAAASGRTLALFTSYRAMDNAARQARARTQHRVLAQGDLPKPALIETFARETSSCLFATMGFWQGIDVPGETLSLVAIDRIPFPRRDEPLLEAKRERAGPAAFRTVDLPRASTLLAQGAGRLIRSSTDRGVVAVLDSRLARASYRWDLINALPPMARTRHRGEVETFLRGGPAPPQ